jgi:hypothetical protein
MDTLLRKRESHIWDRDEHDFYIEPAWVADRLFACEPFAAGATVMDPACGTGNVLRAARAAGFHAVGIDIVARTEDPLVETQDFMAGPWPARMTPGFQFPDYIVSNPPFRLAESFVKHALQRATSKVAMLLPVSWLNGHKRSLWLEQTPLRRVWIISPRPSMPPGAVILAGEKPGGGKTDFAWFVWHRDYDGQPEVRFLRREVTV